MKPIDALGAGRALHDAAASRAVEAQALAGAAPGALMARAGLATAKLALAVAPHARRYAVYAGPGNNGGDGLVAALHLHRADKDVRVVLCGDAARLPADAAAALRAAQDGGVAIAPVDDGAAFDCGIDALLGLGARRAPDGAVAAAVARLDAGTAPVVAVDIPSGLHPDTGALLGDAAVRATATLALLTLKPGLFTHDGRDHAGTVWFDDLGAAAADPTAWLAGRQMTPARHHAQHKGSFGDTAVVGGAPGMTGGAWLAARAASAAGAGRVYVSLLDGGGAAFDPVRPELMGRARWWTSPPDALRRTTVVCGCGGGDAVREVLPALIAHAGRLVVDADGLNAVAADATLQQLLAARRMPTVLTPHPLEAARLLDTDTKAVQADRIAAAQRLAVRYRAVVVLKGSGSIVAASDALPTINPTGNALLASAGTGDVLAGWIGGSWAPAAAARDVALRAVWQHGRAADVAAAAGQRHALRAADLVDAMRAV